jgi:ATP-dependent DNA helicase RecG
MEEAKPLFQKLKIVSLLDLALLLPSSYNNTILSSHINIGKQHTLEARVDEVNMVNGKLRVVFWLSQFNRSLSSMLFKVTPYHKQLFTVGSTHYIQGKVEEYRGYLQMNQPKSLKDIGKIIPKYSLSIKEGSMRSLVESYIREKNLYGEGLNEIEVQTILALHYPKHTKDIEDYNPDVLKFIEAFNYMKKLQAKRDIFPALSSLNGSIGSFIKGLPFQLTKEQQAVIYEVQEDLKVKDKAAKRLIIGDVGSGKTMIILAAAVIAQPHKAILMAPTSLLAIQLYEEAVKHLPDSISTALVMQGKGKGDYLTADFIIGTHALLYKEDLPETSLVMVDEQHRFGTNQRVMLENIMAKGEAKPHYLQFSATPIPRTQAMMLSEMIDVSLITSTPFKKDITTHLIGKEDFSTLLVSIEKEIKQNHQVLIVYPLVEQSEEVPYQSLEESRGFWEKKYDNVYVTHGKDKEKEEVLHTFRDKGDILLATTVVEVGISLPRLTLIVIVGAERLGLATLHQLRGRVGREGLRSWCYLFTKQKKSERLKSFTKTLNGFEIAKLDLEFRHSGDILDGTIQSGMQFKWLDLAKDEHLIESAKMRLKHLNPTQ